MRGFINECWCLGWFLPFYLNSYIFIVLCLQANLQSYSFAFYCFPISTIDSFSSTLLFLLCKLNSRFVRRNVIFIFFSRVILHAVVTLLPRVLNNADCFKSFVTSAGDAPMFNWHTAWPPGVCCSFKSTEWWEFVCRKKRVHGLTENQDEKGNLPRSSTPLLQCVA